MPHGAVHSQMPTHPRQTRVPKWHLHQRIAALGPGTPGAVTVAAVNRHQLANGAHPGQAAHKIEHGAIVDVGSGHDPPR